MAMDVQLKVLGLVKPKEKTGEVDRAAAFSYSNVPQEEDRSDLLHGSQGKELGPTHRSLGKANVSPIEGTILKKVKLSQMLFGFFGTQCVHSLEDLRQSLDAHSGGCFTGISRLHEYRHDFGKRLPKEIL